MKTAALLALGAIALTPTLDDIPVYDPEEGTTLQRTFVALAEYERDDVSNIVNGEEVPMPPEYLELEFSIESLERIVVTDEIESTEDGRPLVLLRSFDELLQESTQTMGEESIETSSSSDLEGRSVTFTWDEDAEEYTVEVSDDDGELDENVLAYLREDLDLRLFLPTDEVETGDSWEVPVEAYLTLMWPSGLLDFYDEDEEEIAPFKRGMDEQTIDEIDGEGEVTFEGITEEDGQRLAVLTVSLEISSGAEATIEPEAPDGEEYPTLEIEMAITRELEGEILWDLENDHLFQARFETDAALEITRSQTFETEEGDVDWEEIEELSGTIEYSVDVERL